MIRETVSLDDVVAFLNEFHKCDPQAAAELFDHRVPCNLMIAQHPTIQVTPADDDGNHLCGFIGLLNGLFGTADDGWGAIALVYDDATKKLIAFKRVR